MAEPLRFDGRVAVVTGAGRGLGRAYVHMLAARGAQVIVNDLAIAGEDPATAVANEIIAAGGSAVASHATVATAEGAADIVAAALDTFGRIDILVNNAGISVHSKFPDTTAADFRAHLDVHLAGSFNVTRAAWGAMVAQDYGRVVMTTSASALYGNPSAISYASAKAGLLGLGRALANAGEEVGIKVNVLSPQGFTRLTEANTTADIRLEVQRRLAPEQVAPMVAFLAHESCPVSGEIYYAGGGRIARDFLAQTVGYWAAALTPEDIVEHWEEINDEVGYHVIRHLAPYLDFGRQSEDAWKVKAPGRPR